MVLKPRSGRLMVLASAFGLAMLVVSGGSAQDRKPAETKKATAEETKKAQEAARRKAQEEAERFEREYVAQLKKAQEEAEKNSTHKLFKAVKIERTGSNSLQTLSVDGEGRILALVAPPRGFNANQKGVTSAVHVLDADGVQKAVWQVPFHASAVNSGPDGTVYVAGDGKLAKFSKDGKSMGEPAEFPFIADMLKGTDALRKKAETQVKSQKENFARTIQTFKDRIAKIKEKKEEDRTKSEQAQLKQSEEILASYAQTEKYYASMTADTVLQGMLGRVKVISSVSASEKEIFIVCGDVEGYGFGVWRMGSDLKDAKKILSNVSGCCGQMDVQCCGADILVAENTKHRFARYDRDGKELSAGGKRGKETEPGCFGGCCNPMNVRSCGGDVLTAESEGIIKRFTSSGQFVAIVGAVQISGGCKNVAVAANKDGSRVYFCDQPGGQVMILAKKTGDKVGSR